MDDFKNRIKQTRKILGKNQKEIAEICGVSESTWQSYERGTTEPQRPVLTSLCALGISPTWLVLGVGAPHDESEIHPISHHQWPFPWPYHPMLMQTVIEGVEETIIRLGLQDRFPLRKKAKTIISIYETLIPAYADGTQTIEEDDGMNAERLTKAIRLIAG